MIPLTAELNRLLDRARAIVDAMTSGERAAMNEAQRRSWVRGELMMEHPAMTAAEANALLDVVRYGGPVRLPVRPVRLRLSRRKGFNLQEHSRAVHGLEGVAVTRGPGRKWGNPFVTGRDGDAAYCVSLYRALASGFIAISAKAGIEEQKEAMDAIRAPSMREALRGRNLACACAIGAPCHADVLLELANKPTCERVG
jgi:hypothetical protein